MEDKQYAAIVNYLDTGVYPEGLAKGQKYVLRSTAKNFKVENEKLYYRDLNRDGTALNRLVLRKNEIERVFLECHLTAGGHKGRDATIQKIRERYHWPNYYKQVIQPAFNPDSYIAPYCYSILAACILTAMK